MSELKGTAEQQQRIRELEEQVFSLRLENQGLSLNEERYRALFERAADYILILAPGADGIPVIVDLNEAACAVNGYSREELLGKPISFLDSIETQKNIPGRFHRIMHAGPETFEAVHKRGDGTLITVEVTATPVVIAGKQYIYAIERDITAWKRAEVVLRNYERIISTSREHMSLVDRHYVYQAVNDTYLTAHNLSRDKIVGHSVVEVHGQQTFETLVKDRLDRCLAGEEMHYQSWFHYAGLGRKFMDVVYYPVVDPDDGSVSGVVVNAHDLTAQHEAEEALLLANDILEFRVTERTVELEEVNSRLEREIVEHRRSEARYRAIVEDQTELVCRFRPDGVLTFVNEAYCRYFGKSCQELVGQSFMPLIPEEDRELVNNNFVALSRERPFSTLQHRVILPFGDIRWQAWNDLAIFDESGQIVEYQAVGRDITDRRQMEDDLRLARQAAEVASLAKSAFLANMSHEVRTPLNAIIGFVQILKDGTVGPVTSEQQECLEEIEESGHQLLGLINDILELSLLEVGGQEVKSEEFDLALLLGDWLESFRQKAAERNMSLSLDIDQAVGMMTTDSRILKKVVRSLLENAIKFTPAGGRVGINMGKEKDEIQLTVWDSGIGMSEAQLKILFQPFQQGEGYMSKQYRGVGLGLVLCKRFLELLGGRIQVESTLGKGSSFTFVLPAMVGDK